MMVMIKIFKYAYIYILACLYVINAQDSIDFASLDHLEISCYNARYIVDSDNKYCPYVDWLSANIYTAANYSYYSPGTALSNDQQRDYAGYLYSVLSEGKSSLSSTCAGAIRRLACVSAFPSCEESGSSISSVSYYQPCKLQCSQINALCAADSLSLSCSSYPESSCSLYVDPNYFVLPYQSGPYEPLMIIYIIVFVVWLAMSVSWSYMILYPYKTTALPICRVVASIPYVKVVVLIFGVSFWITCNQWQQCSFWLGVALLNAQLIYEAGQMIILMLVAKGWSITTQTLEVGEWRNMILLIAIFYVLNSILVVLQSTTLSSQNFLIAVGALYGFMYLNIINDTMINVRALQRLQKMFTANMPPDIIKPAASRYYMYICYIILVFISLSMEFISHGLLSSGSPYWIVLLVYEVSNMMLFLVIGYIYRPQEHSPYFFMVPVRVADERLRAIPVVEAYDENSEVTSNYDIELAALLGREPEQETTLPRKVIMIRNPDSSVAVGVA